MQKKAVVTTFNQSGYDKYGRRMIQSFLQNWPKDISLNVYAEDCQIIESDINLFIKDLHSTIPELLSFKERWKNDPKATGKLAMGPKDIKGRQFGIGFRWDAVRFSHKVYSVCHAALTCDADILFWMDADTVCHSPINHAFIEKMCPLNMGMGFLGRANKYTECGFYMLNLKNQITKTFCLEFKKIYDTGRLFTMKEWHDSWLFDVVREEIKKNNPDWQWIDWSTGLITGEGHPLINTEWGAYLDHLKGARKDLGRSKPKDLKVQRTEKYWKN